MVIAIWLEDVEAIHTLSWVEETARGVLVASVCVDRTDDFRVFCSDQLIGSRSHRDVIRPATLPSAALYDIHQIPD